MYYVIKESSVEGEYIAIPYEVIFSAFHYAQTHVGCTAVTEDITTHEYRCTRSDLYNNPECSGYEDPTKRQGHYIVARSEKEALDLMRAEYPDEKHFTVDIWKKYVSRF